MEFQKNYVSKDISSESHKKFCEVCGKELESKFIDSTLFMRLLKLEKPGYITMPCRICMDNETKEKVRTEEKTREIEYFDKLINNSGMKKRFLTKTFENYELTDNVEQKKAFDTAKEFADNFKYHLEQGTWLCFIGNVGTGKGHLCSSIIQEVCKQGFSAVFVKAYRLFQSIKECWRQNAPKTENEVISALVNVDLLCIDEIGIQFETQTERNLLYIVMDGRYEIQKPIIITSNETFDRIEEILGVKIIDRIFECGKIIECCWDSYRQKQRIKQNL